MPSWQLPRGRHHLPPEVVERNQRLRLVAGVARAMAEGGYAKLTVERVIAAAGVSRATFYAYFDNKQEAVLVAHDVVFEHFLGMVVRACNGEEDWPLKVKAAIGAVLDYAAAEPDQAQLLVLDAIGADVEIAGRVLASNDHLAALLSAGRRQGPRAAALPDLTEKAQIAAVSAIVAGRLMNGDAAELPELQAQLVELVLIPYIGPDAAVRVAAGLA